MLLGKSFTSAAALMSLCLFTACQSKPETSVLPQPERHWARLLNNNYPLWNEPVFVGKKVLVKRSSLKALPKQSTSSSTPSRELNTDSYFQESSPIEDSSSIVKDTPIDGVKAKAPEFHPNKIEKTLPKVEEETEPKLKLTDDIKAPIEVKNFKPLSVEVKKDISLAPPVNSEKIELSPDLK